MKLLKYTLLSTVAMLYAAGHAHAQKKLIDKLLSDKKDTTRAASFLPLPAAGYAQETGFEFGVVALYSFYTNRLDTLTRNSSIAGAVSFTTKKQSNIKLQADIWSPGNNYHYLAEVRYKNFPFSFFGTGSKTREADKDILVQRLFRLNGETEKRISKIYYAGINAGFEHYRFKDKEEGGIYSGSSLLPGKNGGKVLFMGISQIIDSRNTNTYTTKGSYLKVGYSYAPNLFGSANFTGSLIKADFRNFNALGKKAVLGLNAVYQTIQGSHTPFYLLPQLGNDQIMRGYYTGRYRDNNLIAAQAELRYRFIPRLGTAVFAGAGNVYGNSSFSFTGLKPSYGGGIRYFFDADRGLSVRLDYGIGEKRPGEKRQNGFYASLAEAF